MSERPQLFAKTGIPGAEPDGFYEAVADRFNATLLAPNDIRREIGGGVLVHSQQVTIQVRSEMDRQTTELLRAGTNVMHDSFLNAPHRQEKVFGEAIQLAGAIVTSLCLQTPRAVALDRLEDRHRMGKMELFKPGMKTLDGYIRDVKNMRRKVQWPIPAPNVRVLHLDGIKSTEQLLNEISAQLAVGSNV